MDLELLACARLRNGATREHAHSTWLDVARHWRRSGAERQRKLGPELFNGRNIIWLHALQLLLRTREEDRLDPAQFASLDLRKQRVVRPTTPRS
eukprot:scaffold11849_cov130-Isochrysis_galbana.AAC.6